jgi:hypothetical protein
VSVIDAWAKGGLVEVILPSGLKIKGKLPLLQDMAVNGLADGTLISSVVALGDREASTYDEEERNTWVKWQRVQAAAYIREAFNPDTGEWEPAMVTPEMLAGSPPEDIDALEDIVLRRRTPGQVTAMSRFMADEISEPELKTILREEATGSVTAWSTFRQKPGSPAAGEGSQDVGDQAKPTPRPSRAVRRAGARSGTRRKAGPGADQSSPGL